MFDRLPDLGGRELRAKVHVLQAVRSERHVTVGREQRCSEAGSLVRHRRLHEDALEPHLLDPLIELHVRKDAPRQCDVVSLGIGNMAGHEADHIPLEDVLDCRGDLLSRPAAEAGVAQLPEALELTCLVRRVDQVEPVLLRSARELRPEPLVKLFDQIVGCLGVCGQAGDLPGMLVGVEPEHRRHDFVGLARDLLALEIGVGDLDLLALASPDDG